MNETIFDKLDFGPLRPLLDNDDITDISYCNGGQIWIRSLTQGSIRVEVPGCTQEFMEKLAFQCSNVMGTTFNNAKPFLDAESSELRLNFVHQSIATNGIACVLRKTPAKIRLKKEKLLEDDYFTADIHDILIKCVEGHCNIIVCGETGSGKTEFVKYLASHTKENEKIITIEDTLELHLDKIFPNRDIVAMKTNNVASYTDVLVTCMRQNPKWILLSEVRSAEAVSAVRNSISSGHNILSTIHADKASAIPYRLYSLMETDLDVNQFLNTIYRYIQLGVHIKAYYSKKYGKFHREVDEVTEFYVDDDNKCKTHTIYRKVFDKEPVLEKPSAHLLEYLQNQNIDISNITSKITDRPFENDVSNDVNKLESPVTGENNTTVEQSPLLPPNNIIGNVVSAAANVNSNDNLVNTGNNQNNNDTKNNNTQIGDSNVIPSGNTNTIQSNNIFPSNIIMPQNTVPVQNNNSAGNNDLLMTTDNNTGNQVITNVNDNSNTNQGAANSEHFNNSGSSDNLGSLINVDMNNLFEGMDVGSTPNDMPINNEPQSGVINTLDINSILNDQSA